MSNKLLLTDSEFKQLNIVSQNADTQNQISASIFNAEWRFVKGLLGKELFDELKEQNELGTLTPENQLLLNDYVKLTLAKYALYLALPHFDTQIRNAGVVQQTGDYYSRVDLNYLKKLQDDAMSEANDAAIRLTKFLEEKHMDYPLYNQTPASKKWNSLFINVSGRNITW